VNRSSLSSILGLLVTLGACGAGCGGASGSDPGTGDDDSGTGVLDSTPGGDASLDTRPSGDGGTDTSRFDTAVPDTAVPSDTPPTDTATGVDTSAGTDTSGADSGSDGATTDTADASAADTAPIDTGTPDTTPPDPCTAGLTCTEDTDGDTIPDVVEGRCTLRDTDGDTNPDYIDPDSDNDTIGDKLEWAGGGCDETVPLNDADGDGTPNYRDLDSDNNALPDSIEICPPFAALIALGRPSCSAATGYDFDGDGVMDFLDNDNDHDSPSSALEVGLEDKNELVNNAGVYVTPPIDTDGDSVPDLYDVDSDNDFIFDLVDGLADTDLDGVRNFRDRDSDGDKVPDACEARNKAAPVSTDLPTALRDTDLDGKPDYLDVDSDADLLTDGLEDKNFNCLVDSCESSRVSKDTDTDGVDDFVEVTLDTGGACWASTGSKTPANQGKFYFIEPYSADGSLAPTPTTSPLALSTKLNKGDVGFVVDTTYSMSGEIANLKSSLNGIITSLATKIPDLGVGVAGHDDVPDGINGSCTGYAPLSLPPDKAWYLPTNGYVRDVSIGGVINSTGVSQAQTAVNGLRLADGYDLPESQTLALLHAIGGNALSWGAGSGCPAGSVAGDFGDGVTNFGGLHFRKAALPILIAVSDAVFHNGRKIGSGSLHDVYGGGSAGLPNMNDLLASIKAANARFIGVAAADASTASTDAAIRVVGSANSAYGDMAFLTDNTSSYVPPSAFGGTCKTGIGGATVAADGPAGTCRLIFSLRHDGTGLGSTIVDGVNALLNAIKFDVHVQAIPAAGPVDSVNAFMQKVEPSPTGGTDPVTGATCVTFSASLLTDRYKTPKAVAGAGDILETITAVNPGPLYCFNVVPKPNTTVAATAVAQTFTATLRVLAENGTTTLTLGADRDVLFIVPPIVN
jgi:hypothetical protein